MPSESELINQMFGGDGGSEESLIGEMFPVETPTTTPSVEQKPALGMYEQLRKTAETKPSIFGFRPTNTLSMSIEEMDKLEMNPLLSEEFKQDFTDTLKSYGHLATQPLEVVHGAADFLLSLPGFGLGILTAARSALEVAGGPGGTLQDLYDAASEGMQEATAFWRSSIVEPLVGKPTKESELVGATAMATAMAISKVFASAADSSMFEDSPNIQGALRFTGDIGGLLVLGRLYKAPKSDAVARTRDVATKAVKLEEQRQIVEGIPDEAIKRVQVRQLEIKKAQLEKEAADLKTQIDSDQAIVENLRGKGRKVKKIKGLRTPEQRQAEIEKQFKAGKKAARPKKAKAKVTEKELIEEIVAEPVIEKRTAPLVDRSSGLPKHPTDPEAIAAAQEYNLIYHGRQGGYWYTDATTKSSFHVGTLEDLPSKVAEMRGEPEPLTDVDMLTGARQPEQLSTHDSPFRESPERTQQLREQFETKKYGEDVELMTQKLLNDVNRYLDGDKGIDINHTRELLSTLATRKEELWREFLDPAAFTNWKDVISDAAEWARRAERREGVNLRSKIEQRVEGVPVEEDLALIKALEDQYKKPIEQITDVEVEKFFTEGKGAGKQVDWFGETQLNMMIPLDQVPKAVASLVKGTKAKLKKLFRNKEIFNKTGFWLGRDRKWRYEIDNSKFRFNTKKIFNSQQWLDRGIYVNALSAVLDYPELYKAVPGIKDILLTVDKREGIGQGRYKPDSKSIVLGSPDISGNSFVLIHEVQHAVNDIVGSTFTGSNERAARVKQVSELLVRIVREVEDPKVKKLASEAISAYTAASSDEVVLSALEDMRNFAMDSIYDLDLVNRSVNELLTTSAREAYLKDPGEMEARLAERRMSMSPRLRKAEYPWKTLDKMLMEEGFTGWAVGRSEGTKLYSGIPLDEAAKLIVEGARAFKGYTERAVGLRKIKPKQAIKAIRSEFTRAFVDRSGNIRQSLLNNLGDEGYRILQKMYLSKGASSISANMLKQMQKEVYGGLSRSEKAVLDRLILAYRMIDIGKYKKKGEFKFPEDITPERSVAYSELFPQLEGLPPDTVKNLRSRASAYYEWMKRPLQDMLDSGLISKEEYDALASHNYRRLKLVDVYDQRYTTKIGGRRRTVYDSGVQALARGRETDVFEPSSEIMALEVFNRAYGRVLNNEANKSLLELARRSKENPFVRVKEQKGDRIPSGWQRVFAYEDGARKAIYLSPEMSKEWITNSPEISYRLSQLMRVLSGGVVLRPMATGINWGFALANLPRDIAHAWSTARVYENGKWKSVYNPSLPIFLTQMGLDQLRVFSDSVRRKGRYEDYINEGGGMEFLVHQGRILGRGRRLGTPFDTVQDYLGYFGETSEIMTRLAIRERVIRRRARQQGITYDEAKKNKEITREATFAARDYMDFAQGGGITKAMDNVIPYLNAAVVGTRGLFRAFKENPVASGWRTAQLGAVVTGIYLAARYNAPHAWRDLRGSVDMQNNICIPLPESLSYEDENGQTRYPYLKIPLDPGQKFFKTFFEAVIDKMIGEAVDTDTVVDSLKQFSPVGVTEMPPSLSAGVGYVTNKDFWLNEDIWRRTDKPFSWPRSKEEYIPGKTPQAMIDIGQKTGLSPERMNYALEELFTGGTVWSYMVGKGYDELFSDLPKSNREQHLVEVLSKVPVIKRFLGVTHPYSKHAEYISEAQEKADLEYFIQSRGLDTVAEGYLFNNNATERDVYKCINQFKDPTIVKRLSDRYQFMKATKDLPERSFWLRLHGLKTPARAEAYLERMDRATLEGRRQLRKELPTVAAAGGVLSDQFWAEVEKLGKKR